MPAKPPSTKAQSELVPKITSAISCRWDINQHKKLVVYTADHALTILGFSAITQVAKFETTINETKFEVRVI
jgi:hypothetical protein